MFGPERRQMSGVAAAADHKTEIRPTNSGDNPAQAATDLEAVDVPVDAVRAAAVKAGSPVEECLKLLARALQYFHTYPANSPMCVDAVTTCHSALGRVPGNERLVFVVEPSRASRRRTEVRCGDGDRTRTRVTAARCPCVDDRNRPRRVDSRPVSVLRGHARTTRRRGFADAG